MVVSGAKCLTLPNFELQCGRTLPQAELVYQTYGELNADRSNAILYPTSYGAQHTDIEWLIHLDGILDPTQWFIIIPNMFGNGLSSSPSNNPAYGLVEQGFWFTHVDNVRAQAQLLEQVLRIDRLAMVYGWSMGAQQAYHWGVLYSDRVARIVAVCGTAKTTEHNRIFLESLRSALMTDRTWTGQRFEGLPERGLRTFARIYASWAASQTFYRDRVYLTLGYESLDDYLWRGWEQSYRNRDPHNLLAMLDTWLHCDVSKNATYQGDLDRALASIQAKTLVMPSQTDLYFKPEDCAVEAAQIPNAKYLPIPSIWGHRAGNPHQNPADATFIRNAVRDVLLT